MHVHTITVSFLREKQPVQFEKSRPAVEFVARLEDGEHDHAAAARKLMQDAAGVVYAGLGLETPARVAAALASGQVPEGGAVEMEAVVDASDNVTALTDADPPGGAENEPMAPEVPAEETDKKRRGRPRGSKNTQPKAKAETNGATAPADTGPDIPDDDPTPNISASPENRVNPDDVEADIPADIPEAELAGAGSADEGMTQADLKVYLTGLHEARKMDLPKIKQILASHGVARCEDLPAEKVQAVYNQFVEALGT